MPNPIIKSFAKKSKKSVSTVEKMWEDAKKIIDKEYPKVNKESDRYYALVVGVLKNQLKLDEDATVSSDIAINPTKIGKVQKRVEPDDYISGIPIFNVEGVEFMRASKIRQDGSRYNIKCEKVNAFLRENGYRKSLALRWNGNIIKIK